jgi:hypothetical protein
MKREKPSWMQRFWAIVRYEMLWNIRKKMFIGALIFAFIFATISLALPTALGVSQNPYFATTFSAGSLTFILFAIVTGMYSISVNTRKAQSSPYSPNPYRGQWCSWANYSPYS